MKRNLSFILFALFSTSLLFAGNQEISAPRPTDKDRCAVCGMPVASYANWVASVVFRDGSRVFFDGPKDMFEFLLNVPRYRKTATRQDVANVFVTNYYDLKPMKAEASVFVIGSDVAGPMGPDLVPFRDNQEAASFMKDHKGTKVIAFSEVTAEVLAGLQ